MHQTAIFIKFFTVWGKSRFISFFITILTLIKSLLTSYFKNQEMFVCGLNFQYYNHNHLNTLMSSINVRVKGMVMANLLLVFILPNTYLSC